jgi:catechol 2,3-dioxygenase-like lactoylglutathione lyase family enzyme
MFKQIDYTMVIVSDMARSVEFYRDKLGIPLKSESPDWTEFLTGTTTLALHGGGIKQERRGGADKYAGPARLVLTLKMLPRPTQK